MRSGGKQSLYHDEFLSHIKILKAEVFEKMGGAEYPHALTVAALELYRQHERETLAIERFDVQTLGRLVSANAP